MYRQCFRCGSTYPYEEPTNPKYNSTPIIAEVCPDCYNRTNNRIKVHGTEARKKGGSIGLTIAQWLEKLKASEGYCTYCNRYIGYKALILEHMIPLSSGGNNAIDNVVPSCSACNSQKRDRDLKAWSEYLNEKRVWHELKQRFGLSDYELAKFAIRRLAIQEGLLEDKVEEVK